MQKTNPFQKYTFSLSKKFIITESKKHITPLPPPLSSPVLDFPVTSLAIYECASAFTLCSLVLHAHRVSPKLLRNKRLNLFAIRTLPSHKTILNRFVRQSTPSVRKSALLQKEETRTRHAELASFSQNLLILWKMGPLGVVSASQTIPLIRHFVSPSPTIGEKEIICAKHVKNLSS